MRADESQPLGAGDLERLGTSAYLAGDEKDFDRSLDRAHHEHARNGAPLPAARCAFWLGLVFLLRGNTSQANRWLARARRLIEDRDCAEQGYLLLPEAERQFGAGDATAGFESATRAAAIGERFGDADLATCARHLQGRALILQGRVRDGLSLLDESMLAVVADDLSPIMAGLVYCSVIGVCQQVQASRRAREWTDALGRWCDAQPGLVAFTGSCLVHRAEILQMRGAWVDAMAEAQRACRRGSDGIDRGAPAAALYRQAELHRLRGEFDAAADAYRAAAERGFEPQPGLALLRLAQENPEAARAGIVRALAETNDPLQRAKLLPARVEIALFATDFDAARSACAEMDETARRFDTEVLAAGAAQWQGATALAIGDAHAALVASRRAFDLWSRLEAPYDAARARVTIGRACRALGDDEAAAAVANILARLDVPSRAAATAIAIERKLL